MWEFLKTGDPNIVPEIVGSYLEENQKKIPLILFGNSHVYLSLRESLVVTLGTLNPTCPKSLNPQNRRH